jgi:chemotaxis protein CheX
MKVQYINPFIESATSILSQTTQMEVTRGAPSLDDGNFHSPEVCVVLGIVGDMRGQVIYGASMEVACGIAGKMMGSAMAGLDEMAKSAISELGNMITGNAATLFEKEGHNINISPPTIIVGKDMNVTMPMQRGLIVPLHTQVGDFLIWVCMGE